MDSRPPARRPSEVRGRATLTRLLALLAEQGPNLPFPYSSQVRGKLRELRTQYGKERYRVLYFGAPGRMLDGCLSFFTVLRSTAKLPEGDIRIAEARMKKYLKQLEDE